MTDAHCTSVDNGRRVAFAEAEDGQAALTVSGGVVGLAYRVGRRPKLPAIGSSVEIEGERLNVLAVKDLKALAMVRLTLQPIAADSEG